MAFKTVSDSFLTYRIQHSVCFGDKLSSSCWHNITRYVKYCESRNLITHSISHKQQTLHAFMHQFG